MTPIVITEDRLRYILAELAGTPEIERVPKTVAAPQEPMAKSVRELLDNGVPQTYTAYGVTVTLPDDMADGEIAPHLLVAEYDALLKAAGITTTMGKNAIIKQVSFAHGAVFNRATRDGKLDTPSTEKPKRVTAPKTHLWKGVPVTEKQFMARVKQVGGWDNVPMDSGQVGETDVFDDAPKQLIIAAEEPETPVRIKAKVTAEDKPKQIPVEALRIIGFTDREIAAMVVLDIACV